MPFVFKYADGRKVGIESQRMLNLLGHLQTEELSCGSLCGGHGECGGDRIQIDLKHKGLFSPPTSAEQRLLGENRLSQGWRLACQCFPSIDESELAEIIEVKIEAEARDSKEFDPSS